MNTAVLSKRNIVCQTRRLLRFVGKSSGSPHAVGLGMAIGFIIGWMPFFCMQTVLSLLLCHLLRANKLVPLIPVWLSNPLTFVPINTVNYWVGWKLVGGPPLNDIVAMLERLASPPAGGDAGWLAAWREGFRTCARELLAMGWDMMLPFWLGSFLVGLALAIVAYFVTRRFVDAFREAMRKKRQRNQDRRRRNGTAAAAFVEPSMPAAPAEEAPTAEMKPIPAPATECRRTSA